MRLARLRLATLLLIAAIAGVPAAHATCTIASFKGVYGVVVNGLNGSGEPKTILAQLTSDGAGNLTGSGASSTNGVIGAGIPDGTYTLAKNCTGVATFSDGTTYNFVLNNANKGFDTINTSSGHTQSGYAVAQGTATCTDLGVKHTYSIEAAGIIVGTGDVVYVGQFVLNGTGGITGTLSTSLNGTITSDESITGTYSINSTCTGTVSISTTSMNFDLVVVDGGKELMLMESDAGTVVSGLAQE